MRAIGGEGAGSERTVSPAKPNGDGPNADRPALRTVAITIAGSAPLDFLRELVDDVDPARRMHPAGVRVESLVDEELAPRRCAVDVQPFVTRDLLFRAEIPAGV